MGTSIVLDSSMRYGSPYLSSEVHFISKISSLIDLTVKQTLLYRFCQDSLNLFKKRLDIISYVGEWWKLLKLLVHFWKRSSRLVDPLRIPVTRMCPVYHRTYLLHVRVKLSQLKSRTQANLRPLSVLPFSLARNFSETLLSVSSTSATSV